MNKAQILFEDGTILSADSNLPHKTVIGELVFNTSMSGYQEVMTDPSYSGQIVVMTYPLIGSYGIDSSFCESHKIQISAFIIKEDSDESEKNSFSQYLKDNDVLCLSNLDTRMLTKIIRSNGAMNCLITTEDIDDTHKNMLKNYIFPKNVVEKVSREEILRINGSSEKKIALVDLGIKNSIINQLKSLGLNITIFPYDISADELSDTNFDAVLFSNGPGDPKEVKSSIETAKQLLGKLPLFGICLGHQILALALGASTYKLKFGHRGGNHPVLNLKNGKVLMSSQNHGYAVDEKSLPSDCYVTYKNINDETVEGFSNDELSVHTVQFHPEAGPGPQDANIILKEWIGLLDKNYAKR